MIKPYYYDEAAGITIYNCDCRDLFASLPRVDLILTDPPYGLGNKLTGGNWGERVGRAADWDNTDSETVLSLPKLGYDAIVWGGNYHSFPPSRGWLVWIKRDAVPTVSTAELAWTTFDAPAKYFDQTIAATNQERNGHPTLKPLALIKWCIRQSIRMGNEAASILDPYCGSGTSLLAAKQLGRKAIGIEISETYCQIAVDRLRQEVLPFSAQPETIEQTEMRFT